MCEIGSTGTDPTAAISHCFTHVGKIDAQSLFKGGTALKKCYFGGCWFSEDLDFFGLEDVPTVDDLTEAVVLPAFTTVMGEPRSQVEALLGPAG